MMMFWNHAFATLRALPTRGDGAHGTLFKSSCFELHRCKTHAQTHAFDD